MNWYRYPESRFLLSMPYFNVFHWFFKESMVQNVSFNWNATVLYVSHLRNVQNNETGPQCCLSLVESVMVLSPGGGGGNLKVLIASVDMLSLIRTAFV